MDWNQSGVLALARQSCVHCQGLGLRAGRGRRSVCCECVLRKVFRVCYDRFRHCSTVEKSISKVSLEFNARHSRKNIWGRKNEEFTADFLCVTRRTLSEEEHRLFRFHFLLGADWKLCCRKLAMSKGDFFHAVYRIQQKLGKAFAETEPYGLFPLDEYFGGSFRDTDRRVAAIIPIRPERQNRLSQQVPIKKVA